MALFNVSLLSIFVRPSASVTLVAADVVDPPPASTRLSAFHARPLVPQERLVWTKTGEYDAVVLLDNVRHPMLATGAALLRDAQKVVAVHIDPDDVVAPRPYRSRYFLTEWMAAVREPESLILIESPYEEPCSGPSRDTLLCLRAKEEVSGRVHRITLASLCYYEKGASLQMIAQQICVTTLSCGETMRKTFHAFFLFVVGLGRLGNPGVMNQDVSSASRP